MSREYETHQMNFPELLTGQWLLFGLLGKLLYEYPEQSLLQQLVDEDVFSDVPFAAVQEETQEGLELLQQWALNFAADPQEATLDVKADYTRLFASAARLPVSPWESVYYSEERQLFQESTLDVRAWYHRFGLEIINLRNEPDDHIGLELAFLAHLARSALQALEQEDRREMQNLLEAQRQFSRKHLLGWAPMWCDQMVEYARTSYYRGMALILRGALHQLVQFLDISMAEAVAS